MTIFGMLAIPPGYLQMSAKKNPMPGGSMTWLAGFGNGWKTGFLSIITKVVHLKILKAQPGQVLESFVAILG
jgi:hypothetical protein